MATSQNVHVAIAPPDRLEENLIKQVVAIVNKNLYETRLLPSGKIPRIRNHILDAGKSNLIEAVITGETYRLVVRVLLSLI